MRAPAVGLFFAESDESELVNAVRDTTVITHAHPLAIEGAVLIALATAMAYQELPTESMLERLQAHATSPEFRTRLQKAESWLLSDARPAPQLVAAEL